MGSLPAGSLAGLGGEAHRWLRCRDSGLAVEGRRGKAVPRPWRGYNTHAELTDNHPRLLLRVALDRPDQLTHLPWDVALAEGEVTPARRQEVHFGPAEVQARR